MLHKDFHDFLALLAKHKVRHLVVGGYAVAVYGYPRYTGDLDVFIAMDPQTAASVADAFCEFGFSRMEVDARTFLMPKSIVEVGHEPLKLQVMNAISGVAFDEAYERRETVKIDDLEVPFIGYDDLIRNKSATGRGKDKVDVEELERRRKLSKGGER
ncbi:MAG: nucleotidyltransferase [bacterium]